MLRAGKEVAAHVRRQRDVPCAVRRSVCSSDAPFCQYSVEVLVSISFGSLASPRSSAPALPLIGSVDVSAGERELHFGEVVVLVPGAGARRLTELGVEEHAADAGDMGEHAVEHARAVLVAS